MIQPFEFPNGQLVYNAEDLLELCKQFPVDATNYLIREDLEKWLVYIGKNDLAQCALDARQAAVEDRQKLEEFLDKCHLLSLPQLEDTIPEPFQQAMPEEIEATANEPVEKPIETIPLNDLSPTVTKSIPKSASASVSSDDTQHKPTFLQVMITVLIKILY
ncbi:hypothetical protein NIES4102_05780 [Chondrocystis sp. NIES-4102]|nr:hypothetical protein NIES4102_05780 [Chondrocystis sp. NIES-4102]